MRFYSKILIFDTVVHELLFIQDLLYEKALYIAIHDWQSYP